MSSLFPKRRWRKRPCTRTGNSIVEPLSFSHIKPEVTIVNAPTVNEKVLELEFQLEQPCEIIEQPIVVETAPPFTPYLTRRLAKLRESDVPLPAPPPEGIADVPPVKKSNLKKTEIDSRTVQKGATMQVGLRKKKSVREIVSCGTQTSLIESPRTKNQETSTTDLNLVPMSTPKFKSVDLQVDLDNTVSQPSVPHQIQIDASSSNNSNSLVLKIASDISTENSRASDVVEVIDISQENESIDEDTSKFMTTSNRNQQLPLEKEKVELPRLRRTAGRTKSFVPVFDIDAQEIKDRFNDRMRTKTIIENNVYRRVNLIYEELCENYYERFYPRRWARVKGEWMEKKAEKRRSEAKREMEPVTPEMEITIKRKTAEQSVKYINEFRIKEKNALQDQQKNKKTKKHSTMK